MRTTVGLHICALLLFAFGCGSRPAGVADHVATQQERVASQQEYDNQTLAKHGPALTPASVSLDQAGSANAATQAVERKIIRNANLTLEVAVPTDSQRKVFSIAESHGGFVVTSEMTQQNRGDNTKPEMIVNLVVRVPALKFDQVMDEIRATANRVVQEKRTGQDVTEEFIDLEARVKNQRALEGQFLEIMKRAVKVEDALEVQTQLAEVRTEIERLEGRKRFLENQASLSTINVTLQTPFAIVNTTGFWYSVKSAFADGVDVAVAIVLFLIRAIIALVPVLILIILPAALIAKFFLKRARRWWPKRSSEPTTEVQTEK